MEEFAKAQTATVQAGLAQELTQHISRAPERRIAVQREQLLPEAVAFLDRFDRIVSSSLQDGSLTASPVNLMFEGSDGEQHPLPHSIRTGAEDTLLAYMPPPTTRHCHTMSPPPPTRPVNAAILPSFDVRASMPCRPAPPRQGARVEHCAACLVPGL